MLITPFSEFDGGFKRWAVSELRRLDAFRQKGVTTVDGLMVQACDGADRIPVLITMSFADDELYHAETDEHLSH